MLKIYASAITKMSDPNQIPPSDPRSWLFQWYTHWVDSSTTKDDEINRLYPNPEDPSRTVAEAMWNTCQPHDTEAQEPEDNFLPWHRLYVSHFEKIIASVSGRPDFALPYWNYSTTVQAYRGVIPPQFRSKDDPTFGPLYNALRNPGVNDGQPIQINSHGNPLNLDALLQSDYSQNGAQPGFNLQLEQGLHGAIHVLIGGTDCMGNVPTAARDPIFWMHHCNIDRLWASWNAAGRSNSPIDAVFTFADKDGKPVQRNLSEAMNMANFDYSYDRLEPVPGSGRRPFFMMAAPGAAPVADRVASSEPQGAIRLQLDQSRVALTPSVRPPLFAAAVPGAEATPQKFTERVQNIAPGESVFLVASQLSADAQPGVLYDLFIDLPKDPTPQDIEDHRVGTINFFGIAHPKTGHGRMMPGRQMNTKTRFVSFDVTDKFHALSRTGRLEQQPFLTIIPQGQPIAAAQPVIGKVDLIVQ